MKRFLPVLMVAVIALLVSAFQAAAAETRPNYAVLKAGVYSPASDDLGGESGITNADTGLNLEAAYGRYLAPYFAIEGSVGFFFTQGETRIGGFAYDETFAVVPITVSAKAVIPAGRVEPYFFAGVGAYFVGHESDSQPFGSDTDDDTAAGFHAGAGINVDVSRLIYIGAEFKYRWLEVTTFGTDKELNGLTATADIGFRF